MKKRNLLWTIAIIAITSMLFNACKKDDDPTPITGEALFTYEINGYEVSFTDASTLTGSSFTYAWDFGDNETSTEKNPVHTYATKGEYTVTLTVTDEQNGTHPVSTTILVAKASPVKLDDNSVDDWNAVTGELFEVPLGDYSGVTKFAKFDFDANYIYAYVEFEGQVSDVFQYDMFFDTDLSDTTGSLVWIWPGSGSDFLFEYQNITAVSGIQSDPPAFYDYTGTPGANEWSWAAKQVPDGGYVLGTIIQKGNNVAVEMGFDRAKVPNFNKEQLGIGLMISDAAWAAVGFSPDAAQETDTVARQVFLLDMR